VAEVKHFRAFVRAMAGLAAAPASRVSTLAGGTTCRAELVAVDVWLPDAYAATGSDTD
jgi:hypothetical protein